MKLDKGCIPRFDISSDTKKNQHQAADKQKVILKAFRDHGAVILDGVYSRDRIDQLRVAFFKKYHIYMGRDDHEDALAVGDKRVMITIEIEGDWTAPDIHTHPILYPLVLQLLGKSFIVNGFNSVVSFPGSQDQRLHRDYPGLFEGYETDYALPCFAVSLFVPLIDMTPLTGCTRLYADTHKKNYKDCTSYDEAEVPAGSVMLVDYRLFHCGLANKSEVPRPLLTTVYSRPWFRDHANYKQQEAVSVKESTLKSLPSRQKHLFRLIRHFEAEDDLNTLSNTSVWGSLLAEKGRG